MIITKTSNVISIVLTPDEEETYDYMMTTSSVLFQNYMSKLFNGRKLQQESDLKHELTRTMNREELKTEIEKRK